MARTETGTIFDPHTHPHNLTAKIWRYVVFGEPFVTCLSGEYSEHQLDACDIWSLFLMHLLVAVSVTWSGNKFSSRLWRLTESFRTRRRDAHRGGVAGDVTWRHIMTSRDGWRMTPWQRRPIDVRRPCHVDFVRLSETLTYNMAAFTDRQNNCIFAARRSYSF